MADNFLEYHREEYERRKAEWLKRKKHIRTKKSVTLPQSTIRPPEDEAL